MRHVVHFTVLERAECRDVEREEGEDEQQRRNFDRPPEDDQVPDEALDGFGRVSQQENTHESPHDARQADRRNFRRRREAERDVGREYEQYEREQETRDRQLRLDGAREAVEEEQVAEQMPEVGVRE